MKKVIIIFFLLFVLMGISSSFAQLPLTHNGAIKAAFSVGENKQILFSKGNLQYNAAQNSHACADGTTKPGTWRFAEKQYDIMRENNLLRSATYNGWIDLFTYGASGYNGILPYRRDVDSTMYAQVGNLIDRYVFYDLGVYNAISNGGNRPGLWRIITGEEFNYLFNLRNNASALRGHAVIGDVHGLILLPDDCNLDEINKIASFIPAIDNDVVEENDIVTLNNYSYSEWEEMEKYGAVFLPLEEALCQRNNCPGSDKDSLYIIDIIATGDICRGYYMKTFTPYKTLLQSIYITDGYTTSTAYLACSTIGISVRLISDYIEYFLYAKPNNDLWGHISGDTIYYNEPITLTAIPNNGYHFVQWSDGLFDNPRTLSLTKDSTIIAEFAPNLYSLELCFDVNKGTINGEGGKFEYLSQHTFTAIANPGYSFVKWSDGNTENPRTITLTQDTVITAIFHVIDAENVETTTIQVIPHSTTVDVIWPAILDAETYELTITIGGVTFCTLIFNAQGQLTSIVFHAPAAERQNTSASQQGFKFTVTGLENGKDYNLTINAKDANGNIITSFTEDFSTETTALESVSAEDASLKPRKVIENGRVIILMPDGRKFDANGRRLER